MTPKGIGQMIVEEFEKSTPGCRAADTGGTAAAIEQYRQQELEKAYQAGIAEGRTEAEKAQAQRNREAADRHSRRPPNPPAASQRQGRVMGDDYYSDPVRDSKPNERFRNLNVPRISALEVVLLLLVGGIFGYLVLGHLIP